jgi:hypothetical protein
MKNSVKIIMVVLGGLLIAGFFAWGGSAAPAAYKPRGFDVGITSTMIVPALRPLSADPFVQTNVYSVGDYVKVRTNDYNNFYWCITAGTTTNSEPVWSGQLDITNGSAVFAPVDNARNKLYIQNWGTGSVVRLGFDWDAEVDKGGGLSTGGGSFSLNRDAYQGAVYAISDGSTNLVTTQVLLQ